MKRKPLTQLEFFEMPEDEISKKDKELIELKLLDTVGSYGDSPNTPIRCAARGYAAKAWTSAIPYNRLRNYIAEILGAFTDGYEWAKEANNG